MFRRLACSRSRRAPAAPPVPAVQAVAPNESALPLAPGGLQRVAGRDAAAPVAPADGIAAEPAPIAEPRRPSPLQAPRAAPPYESHKHTALAPSNVTRGARRQAPPFGDVQARETESVVHVSIGRVELTALVAPPAARPKSPPRQPTTSLADYLRGSAGGRK